MLSLVLKLAFIIWIHAMLSIFDIFKVGVGPSSSHTNGPMLAGFDFCQKAQPFLEQVERVQIDLYGSLSLTGRGHHTDRASILGLMNNEPASIDITQANEKLNNVLNTGTLLLAGNKEIKFTPQQDLLFHQRQLKLHENGMKISAFDAEGKRLVSEKYYSIGGGFIKTHAQMLEDEVEESAINVPYPFTNAVGMVRQANSDGISLGTMVLRNEAALHTRCDIDAQVQNIWDVMHNAMQRGLVSEGVLSGGLGVIRRAPVLYKRLKVNQEIVNDPMAIMDWVNLYAFAVSEENAAGGKIVTAPTNGASGVIPAVLQYYDKFVHALDLEQIKDFIAVAGGIGILYKTNASISGAEVGCQGEVGVSSSMAAAGLTALMGGDNDQICMAAEIAMEHSLGMTCDPIGGLVQVPCIERNAMGAMKAINASRMALRRTGKSLISLDKVIDTMYQTGKDMNKKYRETAQGGLAVTYQAPPCD